MTIGASNRNDAVGNGATKVYPYGFKIFAATDLEVKVRNEAGVESTLTYPTHFTVSGVGNANGGNITLVGTAFSWQDSDGDLLSNYAISVRRVRPLTQTTDIRNQGDFFPSTHEDTFDHLVMIDQQQQDEIDRSIKLPTTEDGSVAATVLPAAVARASRLLGFDANGNLLTYSSSVTAYSQRESKHTATLGQTLFNLSFSYVPGINGLAVYVNGLRMERGVDFNETSTTSFTMLYGLAAGDKVVAFGGVEVTSASAIDASVVTFTASGSGAVATNVRDKLREVVSVKDFGAIGDGIADDTAEIQAAIDALEALGRGALFFPAGTYKVTATLTVESDNISIIGAGVGTTFIYSHQAATDVIHVRPSGVGTQRFRFNMRDIAIYHQVDMTAGALLHLERCYNTHLLNVELSSGYGGLHLESCVSLYAANIHLTSDDNFAALRSNSYLLKVSKHASGATPAEIHIANIEARGNTGNNRLDYGILIQDVDGIWFSNLHCGFCNTAAFAMRPAANSSQMSAVNVSNFYLDTTAGYGLLVLEPSTSYTGVSGAHTFNNGQIYNHAITGIAWNCEVTDPCVIQGVEIFKVGNHGVQLSEGDYLTMSDFRIWHVNDTNTTGYGIDIASANFPNIAIENGSIEKKGGNTPTVGINIANGADNFRISGITFEGCTTDIAEAAAAANSDISNIRSDKEVITIVADGGGVLYPPRGHDLFKLDVTNNPTSINAVCAQEGRLIRLIALGGVTMTDGGNLRLAGNFVMTADDVITLVCDGSNWFETGRSVN